MAVGPLQFVFLGVRGEEQRNKVTTALRSLSDRGAIRVLDIVYRTKQDDGTFSAPQEFSTMTDEERQQLRTAVGALIGTGYGGYLGGEEGAKEGAKVGAQLGAQGGAGIVATVAEQEYGESIDEIREHLRELAKDVPVGATAAIALIEHRWMLDLRDQLLQAGVVILGSGLIRPRSLVMLGARMAAAQQVSAH